MVLPPRRFEVCRKFKLDMKALFTLLIFIAATLATRAQNTWTEKADLASARHYAASFSIGNTGYVFGGTLIGTTTVYDELWAFDPTANSWTQKASLPAGARSQAAAFAIND